MHESDKQDDYRFTRPHVEFIEIPSFVRLMFPEESPRVRGAVHTRPVRLSPDDPDRQLEADKFFIDTVYAPETLNDKYNAFLEGLATNPRDLKIMHDHPHRSECEPFSF